MFEHMWTCLHRFAHVCTYLDQFAQPIKQRCTQVLDAVKSLASAESLLYNCFPHHVARTLLKEQHSSERDLARFESPCSDSFCSLPGQDSSSGGGGGGGAWHRVSTSMSASSTDASRRMDITPSSLDILMRERGQSLGNGSPTGQSLGNGSPTPSPSAGSFSYTMAALGGSLAEGAASPPPAP